MKRIAFFIPDLSDGGAQKVVINLLRGMSKRGISLDLLLAHAEGPFLEQVPKDVRVIKLDVSRVAKAVLPLSKYLKQYEPWALISHLNYANVAVVLAKQLARTKTKLVLVEHNTVSAHKSKVKTFQLVNSLMKVLYPKAEHIVTVSEAASRDLEKYIKYQTGQVKTIYNPIVDDQLFDKAKASLDHPWFQPDAPPVFLAVGRLIELKDFAMLIKAFSLLRKDQLAHLVILGEGELREELENLADNLGISEDLFFGGFVDNPYAYMSRSTALVLSSRSEGLPNVLIEAMACGCPVISTDCFSGPREILEAGKYGKLVPVGDEYAMAQAMLQTLQGSVVNKDFLVQRAVSIASFDKATTEYLKLVEY